MRKHILLQTILSGGGGDTTKPTLTISVVSATTTVASMRIVASEVVSGFEVSDITISAGGSLASFATADNITFTVDWTLAAGANTMDVAAGVCADAAGNTNLAATQKTVTLLSLQPDATAGKDAFIYAGATNGNFGVDNRALIGHDGSAAARELIQFDLSSIPAGSTVYASTMSLYCSAESSGNARTMRVFRLLRAWLEGTRAGTDTPATGATWQRYDTTNNWATAGAFGAADCEQTDIGTRAFSATETTNAFKDFPLTASKIQEMIPSGIFTNNGFLIKVDTENNDQYTFTSSDGATAGNRPKFAVVYA